MNQSLEKVFQTIQKKRGGLANIHTAFSDFPGGILAHFEFYEAIILGENLPLKRVEREWLAVETSEANTCPYCIAHHNEALNQWEQLAHQEILDHRRVLLSEFASCLTKEPWKAKLYRKKFIETGFSDGEYQHACFVVAYFNMANRLAFAMDLELEETYKESCS